MIETPMPRTARDVLPDDIRNLVMQFVPYPEFHECVTVCPTTDEFPVVVDNMLRDDRRRIKNVCMLIVHGNFDTLTLQASRALGRLVRVGSLRGLTLKFIVNTTDVWRGILPCIHRLAYLELGCSSWSECGDVIPDIAAELLSLCGSKSLSKRS
jgi:hypothetical protein